MSNIAHLPPPPKRPWTNFLLRHTSDSRPAPCRENARLALEHDKRFRRYALAGNWEGCKRRLLALGVDHQDCKRLIALTASEVQHLQPERRS